MRRYGRPGGGEQEFPPQSRAASSDPDRTGLVDANGFPHTRDMVAPTPAHSVIDDRDVDRSIMNQTRD